MERRTKRKEIGERKNRNRKREKRKEKKREKVNGKKKYSGIKKMVKKNERERPG